MRDRALLIWPAAVLCMAALPACNISDVPKLDVDAIRADLTADSAGSATDSTASEAVPSGQTDGSGGACDDPHDQAATSNPLAFLGKMASCATSCALNPLDSGCYPKCLSTGDGPTLTPACADCYVTFEACLAESCPALCKGDQGVACCTCGETHGCQSAFHTCGGSNAICH